MNSNEKPVLFVRNNTIYTHACTKCTYIRHIQVIHSDLIAMKICNMWLL